MKNPLNYFCVYTDSSIAINNVKFYGYSNLERVDISRLLGAHLKYSGGYKFISKDEIPESFSHPLSLKNILIGLDNLTLYRRIVHYTQKADVYKELCFDKVYNWVLDGDYYHINMSHAEFKSLCKDRTEMIAENEAIGKLMTFLFNQGYEFEYDGTRAKLKIPANYHDKFCKISSELHCYDGESSKTIIRCGTYTLEVVEDNLIPISKN